MAACRRRPARGPRGPRPCTDWFRFRARGAAVPRAPRGTAPAAASEGPAPGMERFYIYLTSMSTVEIKLLLNVSIEKKVLFVIVLN